MVKRVQFTLDDKSSSTLVTVPHFWKAAGTSHSSLLLSSSSLFMFRFIHFLCIEFDSDFQVLLDVNAGVQKYGDSIRSILFLFC